MVTLILICLDFYKLFLYDWWKALGKNKPTCFYLTRKFWNMVISKGTLAILLIVVIEGLGFGLYSISTIFYGAKVQQEEAQAAGYETYVEYQQALEEQRQAEEQPKIEENSTTEVTEETEEKVKCSIIDSKAHNGTYLFSPGEGKFFLVIEIEVINNSNLDILVDYNDFKCYCDDYKVNPEILVYREGETPLYGVVEPGRKIKGHICYELPTDFHHLEIKWGMYGQKGLRNKILSKMTVITFTMDR